MFESILDRDFPENVLFPKFFSCFSRNLYAHHVLHNIGFDPQILWSMSWVSELVVFPFIRTINFFSISSYIDVWNIDMMYHPVLCLKCVLWNSLASVQYLMNCWWLSMRWLHMSMHWDQKNNERCSFVFSKCIAIQLSYMLISLKKTRKTRMAFTHQSRCEQPCLQSVDSKNVTRGLLKGFSQLISDWTYVFNVTELKVVHNCI